MMLIDETMVPDAALPLNQFKAHLRLGTGFGEENLQDAVLSGFLRAAIAAIEGRTGRILIARAFTWKARDWRDRTGQTLPVAPVTFVSEVAVSDAAGGETLLDPSVYMLDADDHIPSLCPVSGLLPLVPAGGAVRIALNAGMAAGWGGLPADLGQAVLLLAAHYYEFRSDTSLGDGCMPFGVTSLIQRYRRMRLSVGAGQ